MRDMDLFCTTIIPTINRSTLSRAVKSVLDKSFNDANFEVIIVNDSGDSLPDTDWQHSNRVQVINTNHRERSIARNTGEAIVKGKYLHFLDDDVLLPGALSAFWLLDQECETDWLLGGWCTVDKDGKLIEEFNAPMKGKYFAHLVAGEGLPIQGSLLRAEIF